MTQTTSSPTTSTRARVSVREVMSDGNSSEHSYESAAVAQAAIRSAHEWTAETAQPWGVAHVVALYVDGVLIFQR